MGPLQRCLWGPPRARAVIRETLEARIANAVPIQHDVHSNWPSKLSIGANRLTGVGACLLDLEKISIGSGLGQPAIQCRARDRRGLGGPAPAVAWYLKVDPERLAAGRRAAELINPTFVMGPIVETLLAAYVEEKVAPDEGAGA